MTLPPLSIRQRPLIPVGRTAGRKAANANWFNASNNVNYDNTNDYIRDLHAAGSLRIVFTLSPVTTDNNHSAVATSSIEDIENIEYTVNNGEDWAPLPIQHTRKVQVGVGGYEAIIPNVDASTKFNVRYTGGDTHLSECTVYYFVPPLEA